LRWCCINHSEKSSSLELRETAYRGKIRSWGKTKTSLRIPRKLADDLWLWKEGWPNSSPEAFVLANPKAEFMDSSNFRNRVLPRLAEELKRPKLTFQVIRRTLAQKKGDVKDIQGMLCHSRGDHKDIYMQEIPGGVEAVIEANTERRLKADFSCG